MKKLWILILLPLFSGCAELQEIASQYPGTVTNTEIATGLKQALEQGIDQQVTRLAQENGFYKNELVRIGLPAELQKVDKTLRDIGLSSLADEGLKVLNRAAEEAVKEATPISVNAVRQISFTDARNILLGDDTAATDYLSGRIRDELYSRLNLAAINSLEEVGATKVWSNIIDRYNSLPLITRVNPDLADYVTKEALEGVFTMIAIEEKQIRQTAAARTIAILKRVFALQDK
jgi:hypothetical protein